MIHLSIALSLLAVFVSSAAIAAPPAPQERAVLAAGDRLEDFEAEGLDGRVRQVSFQGRPTVLMFFLSSCPTCHKMIPEWNRAFERKPGHLRVIGVLMDQEAPGFFSAMPISFPVVRSPGRSFLQSLKVNRAPLTLRLAAGGKVEDVGLGLLDPIRLGEFFRP